MELCHIPPARETSLLPPYLTHHLCIADQVLKHVDYATYYASRVALNDFVIMDTAAFEGAAISIQDLIEAVRRVRPSEVVLPDDVHDRRLTLQQSFDASRALRQNGYDGTFMAVPHGKDLGEYMLSVKELELIPGVTTFGIQEEVQELFGISRAEVVRQVLNRVPPGYNIHLLGVQDDLLDITHPFMMRNVRTADTAKFVVWGLNGIYVDPNETPFPAYPGRQSLGGRMEYFDYQLDDGDHAVNLIKDVRTNINTWKEYLRGRVEEV